MKKFITHNIKLDIQGDDFNLYKFLMKHSSTSEDVSYSKINDIDEHSTNIDVEWTFSIFGNSSVANLSIRVEQAIINFNIDFWYGDNDDRKSLNFEHVFTDEIEVETYNHPDSYPDFLSQDIFPTSAILNVDNNTLTIIF